MKRCVWIVCFLFLITCLYGQEEPRDGVDVNSVAPAGDPLAIQLHEARELGDLDRVLEIEASLQTHRTGGESNGVLIQPHSDTIGGPGAPPQSGGLTPSNTTSRTGNAMFGDDIHIRGQVCVTNDWNIDMAIDSNGNLYSAWRDNSLANDFIQVFRSEDSGNTWDAFGYISSPTSDLKEPSLTIGEGVVDRLMVAFIKDGKIAHPQVAYTPLGTSASWTIETPKIYSNFEGYAKPKICTDSVHLTGWYAYLTSEAIYDSATSNINVQTWRSKDRGDTWIDSNVILGDYDSYAWIDPDISYGTSKLSKVFVSCFQEDDRSLYVKYSEDYAVTFKPRINIYTMKTLPTHPVAPVIAASPVNENVMLCCTRRVTTNDDIGQMYSMDGGASWTTMWSMNGSTTSDEFAPYLCANMKGKSWHLAFNSSSKVYYTHRPQDLSAYWDKNWERVDDNGTVSKFYTCKGVVSNWDTDVCSVAWCDYRAGPADYDAYFDYSANDSSFMVPEEFPTIQQAINAADQGVEVLVGPGVYKENINFNGKKITVKSREGAMRTIIDGCQKESVVIFNNKEDLNSKLEGFTITNGYSAGGGGIFLNDANPYIVNNIIRHNDAYIGGGVFFSDSNAIFTNNTVHQNSAVSVGGNLYLTNSSSPAIMNSIIRGGNAPSGQEIVVASGKPTVQWCNVLGGYPGTGNIQAHPHFVDAANFDYHLQYDSSCRDKGSWGALGTPLTDFEGDPRMKTNNPDIGADEYHKHLYTLSDAAPGKTIVIGFIGPPGAQAGLWMSPQALQIPMNGAFGDWYLGAPLFGPFAMPLIPATGALGVKADIPKSPPGPYTLYLQALIGPPYELTNLCPLYVD